MLVFLAGKFWSTG